MASAHDILDGIIETLWIEQTDAGFQLVCVPTHAEIEALSAFEAKRGRSRVRRLAHMAEALNRSYPGT